MQTLDPAQRTSIGFRTQTEIVGAAPTLPRTLLQASWRDFVFAEVWTRPGLDRRSRLMIAMAGAAMSAGSVRPLEGYIRGALSLGEFTLPELREAALHVGVYGGWSRAEAFDEALDKVAAELGLADTEFPPIRERPWDVATRHEEGRASYEKVMVSPAPPPETAFFEGGIINFVFCEMWTRPGLDQRARRWITLVGVANSAARTPIRSHVYGAMVSGDATKEEMLEFVLQYAVHSGWPMASVVQAAVFEQAPRVAQGLPFEA
jgi:4-carboxymuconolactone decarboxylase